jgi:apolipoprotein N-acyltransferase
VLKPSDAPQNPVPLCVDLDGTLVKTDLLWESLARLLQRNPFALFVVLIWWARGRAFLKRQLARRVTIDPADLPYNEPFLAFLREQKKAGRKLILATASDHELAVPVANHVGLFDEVLGSDGKTNLRGVNKLKALTEKFGERGFAYAGNSATDLVVWRGAREAIVTNAGRWRVNQVARCAKLVPMSRQDYSPLATLNRFLCELFWRSGYLAAIGAGLLLTAAFPKIGMAEFVWIAPAVMMAAARGKPGGDAFRVGYVAGLAHFLSSLYWLRLMPVTGLPILAWLALAAYLALYFAVWTWMVNWWGERRSSPDQRLARLDGVSPHQTWFGRTLWSLGGAAIWVALEMIRARLLGGFPWNLIGGSQFQLVPLIQIASVTGVPGVSFLVVWGSLSLYSAGRMIFHRPTRRFIWLADVILPLATVGALFASGFVRMNGQNPSAATLRITLVQPSIPQTLIWNSREDERRFRGLIALSEPALATKTDLLIWPESAVPRFDEASFAAITNLIRTHQVWLIFNAEDAVERANAKNPDDLDVFNAAFLFDPAGYFRSVYHKQKLVIFGEYIPLARWLPFVKYLTPIPSSFASGDRAVPFELDIRTERRSPTRRESDINLPNARPKAGAPGTLPVNTSVLICFEDIFPQLVREYVQADTDFLVNLTNDGWFGQSAEQWQHLANAVFRAVENGVPLVRCANNGLTCWIDAHGQVRDIFRDETGSVYGAGSITIDLPLSPAGEKRAPTVYNRHGDWLGWGCVVIAAFGLLQRVLDSQRRRH